MLQPATCLGSGVWASSKEGCPPFRVPPLLENNLQLQSVWWSHIRKDWEESWSLNKSPVAAHTSSWLRGRCSQRWRRRGRRQRCRSPYQAALSQRLRQLHWTSRPEVLFKGTWNLNFKASLDCLRARCTGGAGGCGASSSNGAKGALELLGLGLGFDVSASQL